MLDSLCRYIVLTFEFFQAWKKEQGPGPGDVFDEAQGVDQAFSLMNTSFIDMNVLFLRLIIMLLVLNTVFATSRVLQVDRTYIGIDRLVM